MKRDVISTMNNELHKMADIRDVWAKDWLKIFKILLGVLARLFLEERKSDYCDTLCFLLQNGTITLRNISGSFQQHRKSSFVLSS